MVGIGQMYTWESLSWLYVEAADDREVCPDVARGNGPCVVSSGCMLVGSCCRWLGGG